MSISGFPEPLFNLSKKHDEYSKEADHCSSLNNVKRAPYLQRDGKSEQMSELFIGM
jgi:hypothetical protein